MDSVHLFLFALTQGPHQHIDTSFFCNPLKPQMLVLEDISLHAGT